MIAIVDYGMGNLRSVQKAFERAGCMAQVVRDPERFHEVRARTWDDYFDFLPFTRRYLRETLVE